MLAKLFPQRGAFGRVRRQPLELEAPGVRLLQPLGRRAMDLPTIPDDDQRPAQLSTQLLDEGDRLGGANVVVVDLERQAEAPPRRGQRRSADDAQPVVAIPGPLHGRLTARGPRPAVHRLQAKARFVDKNDACAVAASLFLIRGQSCLRHRSTAAASCSRATRSGFCGVKPRSCKMRPRWSGWYETRNFLRTSSATRSQVHKSVRIAMGRRAASAWPCRSCRNRHSTSRDRRRPRRRLRRLQRRATLPGQRSQEGS